MITTLVVYHHHVHLMTKHLIFSESCITLLACSTVCRKNTFIQLVFQFSEILQTKTAFISAKKDENSLKKKTVQTVLNNSFNSCHSCFCSFNAKNIFWNACGTGIWCPFSYVSCHIPIGLFFKVLTTSASILEALILICSVSGLSAQINFGLSVSSSWLV